MKIRNYINGSLSRQVIFLLGMCFLLFIVGAGTLVYIQSKLNDEYVQQRKELIGKRIIVQEIHDQFNAAFLTTNGSVIYKLPDNKEQLLKLESQIKTNLDKLKNFPYTVNEQSFYQEIADFSDYFSLQVLPPVMAEYENKDDRIVEFSTNDVTSRVNGILDVTKSTSLLLLDELNDSASTLNENQVRLQQGVIIFFVLYLILLQFVVRKIFRNVGRPLTEFAVAANEIAAGKDAVIMVDSNRKDELGSLAVAFRKMIESIQGKEQDLVAHNEELLAQQDELQVQQDELQVTLEMLTKNEQKLIQRNELINGISTSLDKEEVLQSIVKSMCKIISADKGLITFLQEDTFTSFGVSEDGVKQFRKNLHNDLNQRIISTKKAFTIKREQVAVEKGYHETPSYCYDLYLPVLTGMQDVEAIMVFSRYGDPFSEDELPEYEAMAKQIGISLEKIKLFEQSEDNRRLNQYILNTVQEGIQLINKDGTIVQINQQLCEIFTNGKSIEEVIGLSWDKWSSLMAEKIQENDFIESLEVAIKAAAIYPNEEHSFIYRKNDSKQVIKVYCKTLNYNEEETGTVIVHRDITKEFEVDHMKSEFVSTVSHELRTPLASVLGFTELMLTKELKPERKTKYLQTIYNEAKRLTALINDFLDVQRMESGKQVYEKKYIDIKPIIEKVIEHQEVNTSLHQIELFVESDRTIILGDRIKMEQVFTNLLSNSIKYSPNGGRISIRIFDSEDMISIDIQDEGLGIPKEALSQLFQRFYRVDNTDRRRIGGTGLGLSIVEEIVKAHAGKVSVISEYGKGSTFTVHFPKVITKDGIQNTNGSDSVLSYNIMVVEDDLSLAELLKYELQDSGFYVNYFNSGTKALEQLKIATPDAIVLDILLEDEIDGWMIMKKMKESKRLKNIPIFISTALDEKERGFSLGAQDYLVKPYKPSQLSKTIIHTLLSIGKQGQIMVPKQINE